jgi:hypothetical protein
VRDRGGGPSDAILVAGTRRGGTRLVERVLRHGAPIRLMSEPFRPDLVPDVRGMPEWVYLRPGDRRFTGVVAAVMSGHPRHNRWVNRENTVRVASRRLVRAVHAHGWLGWFSQEFPGTPVVVVLRHPVVTAASQRRHGESGHLDRLLAQPELVYDHLEPYRALLEGLATPWEGLVGTWCVQTHLALRTMDEGRGTLVLLEDVLRDPTGEAGRLLAAASVPTDPERLSAVLAPPRRSDDTTIDLRSGLDRLSSALDAVSPEERRQAMRVVEAFGLDVVYGDTPLPDSAAAQRIWAAPAVDGPGTPD